MLHAEYVDKKISILKTNLLCEVKRANMLRNA